MGLFKRSRTKPFELAKRKAVYTFIFGDYDDLKSPTSLTPGWDYICFTDDPSLRSDVWDVRLSPRDGADRELDHKKYAIKHMILFNQYLTGYDLSLSIGAQLELNCDLDGLMRESLGASDDMMICRHNERDCIYDEAQVCKMWRLDEPAVIDAQMKRYRVNGYPAHNGLYMTGIIARFHDRANVRRLCDLWWDEYRRGSRRDQLSLNYAIWKSAPINVSALDYEQQFVVKRNFILHPHKRRLRFGRIQFGSETSNAHLIKSSSPRIGPEPDYVGCIDSADYYAIRGWAADRNRLNKSINVGLYDGGELLTTVLASQLRSDVGEYLGDSGLHGFTIPIPACLKDDDAHSISVRFESGEIILTV